MSDLEGMTRFANVEYVAARLNCGLSTAYRHLREASGRPVGARRGLLRVPVDRVDSYLVALKTGRPWRGMGAVEPGFARDLPRRGVYFISGAHMVKIGSTCNLPKRFTDLQCGSPVPLTFLLALHTEAPSSDLVALERELHERFAHLRMHGEWFVREGALLDFILEEASRP